RRGTARSDRARSRPRGQGNGRAHREPQRRAPSAAGGSGTLGRRQLTRIEKRAEPMTCPATRRAAARLALGLAALIAAVGVNAQRDAEPYAQPAPVEVPQRELLNSERIERRFGSYGIDVLQSDGRYRVSNLYSVHDGAKICRTFAVVAYPARPDSRYA